MFIPSYSQRGTRQQTKEPGDAAETPPKLENTKTAEDSTVGYSRGGDFETVVQSGFVGALTVIRGSRAKARTRASRQNIPVIQKYKTVGNSRVMSKVGARVLNPESDLVGLTTLEVPSYSQRGTRQDTGHKNPGMPCYGAEEPDTTNTTMWRSHPVLPTREELGV